MMDTNVSIVNCFMESFVSIGERLRAERVRLDLSQEEFAALAGAHRKSQGNYEKGERQPDAAYLAAIAAAGADVLYILTGVSSATQTALAAIRQATEISARMGGSPEEMAERQALLAERMLARPHPDEDELLRDYRRCTPDSQATIRQLVAQLAKSATGQGDQ